MYRRRAGAEQRGKATELTAGTGEQTARRSRSRPSSSSSPRTPERICRLHGLSPASNSVPRGSCMGSGGCRQGLAKLKSEKLGPSRTRRVMKAHVRRRLSSASQSHRMAHSNVGTPHRRGRDQVCSKSRSRSSWAGIGAVRDRAYWRPLFSHREEQSLY